MRTVLFLASCLTGCLAIAQETVSSGGGHYAGGAVQISANIGEPVIATVGNTTNVLTQGFEQPWADITTVVHDPPTDGPAINVYPNPVRHTLHIALENAADAQHYYLHDAAGRLVTEGRIGASITDLDMQPYASGGYLLRVLGNDHSTLQSFKISVTH